MKSRAGLYWLLAVLVASSALCWFCRTERPKLQRQEIRLVFIDYREGNPPLVVEMTGKRTGGPTYKASRGNTTKSGCLVATEFYSWLDRIENFPLVSNPVSTSNKLFEVKVYSNRDFWLLTPDSLSSSEKAEFLELIGHFPNLSSPY